jgi:hypothetical protein
MEWVASEDVGEYGVVIVVHV